MEVLIDKIGPYAGIAAFLAVALLALLYFSQARDVRRLRDWAGRAPERTEQAVRPPQQFSPETAELARPRRARLRMPRLLGKARYIVVAIAGLLVFGAAISYGVLRLSDQDSSGTSSKASSKNPKKDRSEKVSNVQPSQVTVAVLNGTTTPGLAATIGSSLKAAGFKVGNVTNASETGVADTKVLYAKGKKAEARAVAQQLKIKQGRIFRMDTANAALAGSARVAVVTGQDRAKEAPKSVPSQQQPGQATPQTSVPPTGVPQ